MEVRGNAPLLSACKADVLLLSPNPLVSDMGVGPIYAKLMRLARYRPTARDININGDLGGNRTRDSEIKSFVLYQLSYQINMVPKP